MKNIFKKLLVLAIMLVPVMVNAENVSTEEALIACLEADYAECVLTDNIVLTSQLEVGTEATIDLKGRSITPAADLVLHQGLIVVLRGANLTVNDSVGTGKISSTNTGKVWGGIQLIDLYDTNEEDAAELTINGGTIEGYWYAVVGNGTLHNTIITINGGTLKGLNDESLGIYHPQDGTLIINDGEITGGTGIEIRSGNLIVNGGEITGTYVPLNVTANGNGSTTDGAGIAIAQHTTKKAITVEINGGEISGYQALYESNPENNPAEDIAKISITINDGKFTAINGSEVPIYSQDCEAFIVEGEFTQDVDSKYIKEADYTELDAEIYKLSNTLSSDNYVNFEVVSDVLPEVIEKRNNGGLMQSEADALLDSLTEAEEALELKSADYTDLDETISLAESYDESLYTTESYATLIDALDAVERDLDITDQDRVDQMKTEIETAISELVLKDADYTDLASAILEANGYDSKIYTEESYKALTDALAAVEMNLDITKQDDVDGMAADIITAISGLTLKTADYSKLNIAIEEANVYIKHKEEYTSSSIEKLQSVLATIKKDLDITRQAEVDKMNEELTNALLAMVSIEKEVFAPVVDVTAEVSDVVIGVTDKGATEDILLDTLKASDLYDKEINMAVEVSILPEESIEISETIKEDMVATANKKLSDDIKIAKFFDITLNVVNTDENISLGNLAELKKAISLSVVLPEELKNVKEGYTREYYIVRYHDGESEILNAKVAKDLNSLTFESDKFSTYAIAYRDVKNPQTNDSILGALVIGIVSSIGLGISLKVKKFN